MSAPIKCFLLEPTTKVQTTLRRYHGTDSKLPCPQELGYHDAEVVIALEIEKDTGIEELDHADARWPQQCQCGYVFTEEDQWQVNNRSLYRRSDTGELITLHRPPVGAIWDAEWYPDPWKRADGHCYLCQTPGGEWNIDSEASNCTRKGEPHACWVRHGIPGTDSFHVDKGQPGESCAAGAGSIICGGWHGFLHQGYLVEC